jgi:ATP-dependent exoDNAse (exonuclease V) beta subunit
MCTRVRAAPRLSRIVTTVGELLASRNRGLCARTVHLMVVIRRPHPSDPTSQLELWEAAVSGAEIDPEKAEERRVLFVALTRARRYCLVGLPDDARGRAVAAACDALGFESVQAT